MIYKLAKFAPDSLILLPREALGKMDQVGETELKILLSVCEYLLHGELGEDELFARLSARYSAAEIATALAFWRGAGILRTAPHAKNAPAAREAASEPALAAVPEKVRAETPEKSSESAEIMQKAANLDAEEAPFYTAKDLADAADANPDFKNLVSFAEGRLEKVMNTSELARLWSFLDYLKLPADVVMLSVEDCCSRGKSSLRYIHKQLLDFIENGADCYEKAEALLVSRREKRSYENFVRNLFGLGERKLVPKEKEAIANWKDKWNFGREILEIAYEKTVSAAKKPSISYMNKILEGWHESGVSTPEEAQKGGTKPDGASMKSYDLDDFFNAAVSKNRKI